MAGRTQEESVNRRYVTSVGEVKAWRPIRERPAWTDRRGWLGAVRTPRRRLGSSSGSDQ